MGAISFSVLKILSSLLDKSKTQTIRPAWNTKEPLIRSRTVPWGDIKQAIFNKPPRFKVGDKVKLYWKQRSKYQWFCKWCGDALVPDEDSLMTCNDCLNSIDRDVLNKYEMCQRRGQTIPKAIIFNKLLGTAEITEVFEIEMHFTPFENMGKACIIKMKDSLFSDRAKIAELDGFKDTVSMFKVLDKIYDLKEPKKFYVYRWKWLK